MAPLLSQVTGSGAETAVAETASAEQGSAHAERGDGHAEDRGAGVRGRWRENDRTSTHGRELDEAWPFHSALTIILQPRRLLPVG